VHPNGADSMAVSGLRVENALVGAEWVTAVLLCTNELHGTHFQQGSLYSSLGEQFPAECCHYCKLFTEWGVESRMCRG